MFYEMTFSDLGDFSSVHNMPHPPCSTTHMQQTVHFLAFYYIFTTYLKNSYIFHENGTLNNGFHQVGRLML